MGKLLEKEIAELRARGISLDSLTADEVEGLVHAVDRMARPFSAVNVETMGLPVRLGDGTTLYNLTIGATVWLDEFAAKWWDSGSKAYFWALVYALRFGRDKGAFEQMLDKEEAKRRIVDMAVRIHLTEDELLDGIEQALHSNGRDGSGDDAPAQQVDWGSMVRALELATGIPADEWVWNRSTDWCVREFHRNRSIIEGMKGGGVPRMKDELDRATNALARVRCGIVSRLAAEAEGKEAAGE